MDCRVWLEFACLLINEETTMHLPRIQTTLYANALFSSFCGLFMLLDSGWWSAEVLDVPEVVFIVLGAGLLLFALDVLLLARAVPPSILRLKIIFAADLAWVAATPILLLLYADYFSSLGVWLTVDVAVIVAMFAMLEWLGIKRRNALSP